MKRILLAALMAAVIITAFSGCNSSNGSQANAGLAGADQTTYPIQTDAELTYWMPNSSPVGSYTDKSQYPFYKALQEKTGVKVNFKFPALGQEIQQFNILIASGDLPDIVEYTAKWLSGSHDKTIEENSFENLNHLVEYMPNYTAFLDKYPTYKKYMTTEKGNMIAFGGFVEPGFENEMTAVAGIIMRQDWLDELHLEVPETIDELTNVLRAFKAKSGVEAPAVIASNYLNNALCGAFGIGSEFYQEDGKVKYGPMQPGYKHFLETVNLWYSEGLLNKNIASLDNKTIDYAILNDKAGVGFGWIGSAIGTWTNAAKEKNPNFKLVGIPYPVLNKGEKSKFSLMQPLQSTYASIGAKSEHKELAARFMDYGYSPEGRIFYNFGVEGTSYNLENDYPKYSDLIMKNPDGLSIAQAMQINIRGNTPSPSVQDHRYIEQFYQLPEQREALQTWSNVDTRNYEMPPVRMTQEETDEYSQIMNDINTYQNESYLKFLLGKQPVSEFDEYVSKLQQMNIQKAIDIQQAALDRYKQ